MNLYNVRSRQIEALTPVGDEVTLYVCGITPYDTTHLGHAFTYATFDLLIRALEWQGNQVRYVQNVTDIDDDILRKAGEVAEDWQALGERWTRRFIDDLATLNIRPPDHFPRATEFIDPIIDAVVTLVAAELAYEAGGNVYFDLAQRPSFGALSRIPEAERLAVANERGNHPDDPHKRHPLDFVLWQAQAPDEPAWSSPWGPGRPGWHIECSTMATALLGPTIDIHGGGADLIFPHHESEIVQAEGVTGQTPFARFWLHTAMVRHDGEKMSKSLGNLILARHLLQHFSADAIRLYLAGYHYRDAWAFDERQLAEAAQTAAQWQTAVTTPGNNGSQPALDAATARTAFRQALADDLNSPTAVATLSQLATQITAAAADGHDVNAAQTTLRELAAILGLRLNAPPEERVTAGWAKWRGKFGGEG